VELSAVEGDIETHILGLHLSELTDLEHRLVALREMRVTARARMVERLNALGIAVTFERCSRRPRVALSAGRTWRARDRRRIRDGFSRSVRTLPGERQAGIRRQGQASALGGDGLIHKAGGSPSWRTPDSCHARTAGDAGSAGLDGVEVLHPSHSWTSPQRLDALPPSSSSFAVAVDWHGARTARDIA